MNQESWIKPMKKLYYNGPHVRVILTLKIFSAKNYSKIKIANIERMSLS